MDNPVIGFGIDYGNEIKYCEAIMADTSFDIYFNGEWIASIEHNDHFNWMQASGAILPQATIDEIGLKIESHHN
jgi:hypothetical protein